MCLMGNIRFHVCLRCNTESEWSQIHENIIKKANSRYNLSGSNTGKNGSAPLSLSFSPHIHTVLTSGFGLQCFSFFGGFKGTDPFMFSFIVRKRRPNLGGERIRSLFGTGGNLSGSVASSVLYHAIKSVSGQSK